MAPKTAVFFLSSMAMSVMALPARNFTATAPENEPGYCYSKDPKPYTLFGSMEAYEPKRGDLSKIQSPKGTSFIRCSIGAKKFFVVFQIVNLYNFGL